MANKQGGFTPKKLSGDELQAHLDKVRRERFEKERKQTRRLTALYLIAAASAVLAVELYRNGVSASAFLGAFFIGIVLFYMAFSNVFGLFLTSGKSAKTPAEEALHMLRADLRIRQTIQWFWYAMACVMGPIILFWAIGAPYVFLPKLASVQNPAKLAGIWVLVTVMSVLMVFFWYRSLTSNRKIIRTLRKELEHHELQAAKTD